ncbi:MAG: twin-arginine translocase TatA/TatE family subunit [Kiritimatiellae bacterium]|jgi:sec-independent protein translocase protein TatA|nr:twin-arginine translocase TatA/TatE family subunit [Kiritimatiellia bacterium]
MTAGPWQILICIVIILVLFGGKKIPELARSLGKAKGEFKKGLAEGNKSSQDDDDEVPSKEAKQIEKEA